MRGQETANALKLKRYALCVSVLVDARQGVCYS